MVGAFGAPGAGEIIGKDLRLFRGPGLEDGRVERPVGFDAVAMGEERLVAEHGVEKQALVAVGAGLAEGGFVIEVHVDGADGHLRGGGHLGAEAQGDALVGLDADGEQVGLNLGARARGAACD